MYAEVLDSKIHFGGYDTGEDNVRSWSHSYTAIMEAAKVLWPPEKESISPWFMAQC